MGHTPAEWDGGKLWELPLQKRGTLGCRDEHFFAQRSSIFPFSRRPDFPSPSPHPPELELCILRGKSPALLRLRVPLCLLAVLPNGACFTSASPHWPGERKPLAASVDKFSCVLDRISGARLQTSPCTTSTRHLNAACVRSTARFTLLQAPSPP